MLAAMPPYRGRRARRAAPPDGCMLGSEGQAHALRARSGVRLHPEAALRISAEQLLQKPPMSLAGSGRSRPHDRAHRLGNAENAFHPPSLWPRHHDFPRCSPQPAGEESTYRRRPSPCTEKMNHRPGSSTSSASSPPGTGPARRSGPRTSQRPTVVTATVRWNMIPEPQIHSPSAAPVFLNSTVPSVITVSAQPRLLNSHGYALRWAGTGTGAAGQCEGATDMTVTSPADISLLPPQQLSRPITTRRLFASRDVVWNDLHHGLHQGTSRAHDVENTP